MIVLQNIRKDFGEGNVLKNINLTFNEGEITVIMGPSGSGKSTLLRTLNYLEIPTEGTVTYRDSLLSDTPKVLQTIRRKMAMVFQSFYLFNHLSALKNCALAVEKLTRMSKQEAQEKALSALSKVGMAAFAHRRPSQLSGGQKQRVAIARALSIEPEVILFDEPTSALDPEMVQEVLDVMRSLAAEQRTMIIVTHEVSFAKDVAHRIIFMEDGQVIEDSSAPSFFASPQSDRAKRFLKLI